MALSVVTVAIIPSLLDNASAQTESRGPANIILISSFGKNYKCFSSHQSPPTLGNHLNAVKQGGTVKGQWHIVSSGYDYWRNRR